MFIGLISVGANLQGLEDHIELGFSIFTVKVKLGKTKNCPR